MVRLVADDEDCNWTGTGGGVLVTDNEYDDEDEEEVEEDDVAVLDDDGLGELGFWLWLCATLNASRPIGPDWTLDEDDAHDDDEARLSPDESCIRFITLAVGVDDDEQDEDDDDDEDEDEDDGNDELDVSLFKSSVVEPEEMGNNGMVFSAFATAATANGLRSLSKH